MPRTRSARFTLIELLVVVAIIAILAAMLMPALSKARRRVHETGCASNLKVLGLSYNMYADESEDFYPINSGTACPVLQAAFPLPYLAGTSCWWCFKVWPYVNEKRMFQCPEPDNITWTIFRGTMTVATSYCTNSDAESRGSKRTRIRQSESFVWLGHGSTVENDPRVTDSMMTNMSWWPGWHGMRLEPPFPRYSAGACGFLFADGHADYITFDEYQLHPEYSRP